MKNVPLPGSYDHCVWLKALLCQQHCLGLLRDTEARGRLQARLTSEVCIGCLGDGRVIANLSVARYGVNESTYKSTGLIWLQ